MAQYPDRSWGADRHSGSFDREVDDEGELGVVIGRRALGVAEHDALDVIHGYEAMTLEPGDLILTGTPAGVGAFRDPEVWLTPGDVISVEIEGIGSLSNPVCL